MARPQKDGDSVELKFSVWNPNIHTASKFGCSDFRIRYKALRNSSSGFIRRADVRQIIFEKYHGKCYICGSTDNLQIDHIISVYKFAVQRLPYKDLNKEENLALICRRCNCQKRPER